MPKKSRKGKKANKTRKQRQKLKERRKRERKRNKQNNEHITAEKLREREERKILKLREREERKILKLQEKEKIRKKEEMRKSKKEMSRQFYRINKESYTLEIGNTINIAGREGKFVLMRGRGEMHIRFKKEHKKNRVPYLNWSFCTCIKFIHKYNDDNKLLNNMCDFQPSHSYSPCDCDCGSTNLFAVMIYQNNYFGRTGKNWNPREWPFSYNNNYNPPVCTCKYCEKQKMLNSPVEMKKQLSSCCKKQKTIFYEVLFLSSELNK